MCSLSLSFFCVFLHTLARPYLYFSHRKKILYVFFSQNTEKCPFGGAGTLTVSRTILSSIPSNKTYKIDKFQIKILHLRKELSREFVQVY